MILAIDIGGTRFRVAAVSEVGDLVRVSRRRTNAEGGAEWMIGQVLEIARKYVDRYDIDAIGVGFGGPVRFDQQRIVNSTHVPGWDNLDLPGILRDEFNLPAIVDNDANVGALGEFVYGAGRGYQSMVYYTVSTGIGGGIIIDGDVYRGANGNAGELGHVPILLNGPRCDCGKRGCLEALCSGPAIGRRGSRRMKCEGLSAREVFDAARKGVSGASRVVLETAQYLGMGIATTINTLSPDLVVIGGGVAKAGRILLDPLRISVQDLVMPVHRASVRVLSARRGDNAVLMGAAALTGSID